MSHRFPLAALAAAAATLAAAPTALATFPGENGAIAFSRGGDIWVVAPDGSDERRLTSGAEHEDRAPEWSPDGRELMFQRTGPEGVPHMYRMRADGSGVTWIGAGLSPQFSPDGRRIAFGSHTVMVANRDGSNPEALIDDDENGRTPYDWSPINDLIAWEARNNISWIGAVSVQGSTWAPKLPHDHPDVVDFQTPAWSPDGTRLAVGAQFAVESGCWKNSECIPHADVGLTVMDLGGRRTIVHPNGLQPAWSPDGTRFAFVENVLDFKDDPPEIHVIGVDGRGDRVLTTGSDPDWQPLPARPPAPPRPPETRTVTVTVQSPAPPPAVVEKVVTRTVRVPGERCVIPQERRRLILTVRTRRAIPKGATIRIGLTLEGARVAVTPARGTTARARWAVDGPG